MNIKNSILVSVSVSLKKNALKLQEKFVKFDQRLILKLKYNLYAP